MEKSMCYYVGYVLCGSIGLYLTLLMFRSRLPDLLTNVAAPVMAGVCLYVFSGIVHFPVFLTSYVADLLWAYALASLIIITWDRQVHPGWLTTAFLSTVTFEVLQMQHIVEGTGDWADVLVYAVGFMLALLINYLITNTNPQTTRCQTEPETDFPWQG